MKKIYAIVLCFIIISVMGGIFVSNLFWNNDYTEVLYANKAEDAVPLGEIIEGDSIKQKILINRDINQSSLKVRVMMATYMRVNTGSLKVTVEQDNKLYNTFIDTSTVQDNAYHDIWFRNVTLEPGEADLILQGIDGMPGNAVTVYLTSDVPYNGVIVNGQQRDKGLMYSLAVLGEESSYFQHVISKQGISFWLFVFLYLSLTSCLTILFAGRESNES